METNDGYRTCLTIWPDRISLLLNVGWAPYKLKQILLYRIKPLYKLALAQSGRVPAMSGKLSVRIRHAIRSKLHRIVADT